MNQPTRLFLPFALLFFGLTLLADAPAKKHDHAAHKHEHGGHKHQVPAKKSVAHNHTMQHKASAFDTQMKTLLAPYLAIHQSLAAGSITGVAENAKTMSHLAKNLDASKVKGMHAAHYIDIPNNLQVSLSKLMTIKIVINARNAFKELSKPMAMWVSMAKPSGVHVVYCDKAKASWIQEGSVIKNPYGIIYSKCGTILN